jgi:hypothetical protein
MAQVQHAGQLSDTAWPRWGSAPFRRSIAGGVILRPALSVTFAAAMQGELDRVSQTLAWRTRTAKIRSTSPASLSRQAACYRGAANRVSAAVASESAVRPWGSREQVTSRFQWLDRLERLPIIGSKNSEI